MENARRFKLIGRWSLVTAGAIALFWTIWNLATGSVPVVTSIKMMPEWTIQFPFGISRWWDILIGPIWSTIIILILTSQRIQKDNDLFAGLTAGLVAGLTAGLVAGLGAGLGASLVVGLVVGLVAGLLAGLLVVGPCVGLGAGLGVGLGAGLVAGLLVAGLGVGLAAGLVVLVKWVCLKSFWGAIGNWLLASDAETEKT